MKTLKTVCLVVAVLACVAQAKNTYSVFSLGTALPLTSAAPTPTGDKELDAGIDAGWTFFGFPFAESGPALAGLSFGGKIGYNRWMRDSTRSEVSFLGTQGIVRYYTPPIVKPFDLFVQAGFGMFIGEHGFNDPDTLNHSSPPSIAVVSEGKKNTGVSFVLGFDLDVVEIAPGMTMVFTKGKTSAWYSISAAMKF